MLEHEDYLSSPNKVRKRRNQRLDPKYLVLPLAAIAAVRVIVPEVKSVEKPASGKVAGPAPTGQVGNATPTQADPAGVSPEEEAVQKEARETDNVVSSYNNLGIMQVSGYLNIRKIPSIDGKIIGKLSGDGACEILATEGDWSHITSGGVEGYISNQYLLVRNETREKVEKFVKLRAAVMADNLNIRQAPILDLGNVIGQALKGECYVARGLEDGWIQTEEGYISSKYTEVAYSLNEGHKMDMETMVINQHNNLVISKVNSYPDVHQEPRLDGKIMGKMANKAADEILKTLDGWYEIESGPIISYISADPQYVATGQGAKDIVMQNAAPKAIINTDVLSVHTKLNMEAKVWTQIIKGEHYPIVTQLDDWIRIDLDSVDEEDGSEVDKASISTRGNNVEVHYVLNEAIKFPPAEVTINNAASRRSEVMNYALQFVGNPRVWGGASLTKGVDCSGFTMQVMKRPGVSLPHYSDSQAKMGKAVTSSDTCPDDLILYAGSGGQVNHIAIYIGDGQVVRAASRKNGIKISAWNYKSSVAIRNVLGDQIKKTVFYSESRSAVSAGRLFSREAL